MERSAVVWFNSWAGLEKYECTVIGETPKRYRVVYPFNLWRNHRLTEAGKPVLVPKHAVEFVEDGKAAQPPSCNHHTRP